LDDHDSIKSKDGISSDDTRRHADDDEPDGDEIGYSANVIHVLRRLGEPATLFGESGRARLARMYSLLCSVNDNERGHNPGEPLVLPHGFTDWDDVRCALRHMGQPVRLFGETDYDVVMRMKFVAANYESEVAEPLQRDEAVSLPG